jgi:hypothetical protein
MPNYKHDWVGPLLAFLKEQSVPVNLDEQTLDRILIHVGRQFVPADLDRTALRSAIAKAIEAKEYENISSICTRTTAGPWCASAVARRCRFGLTTAPTTLKRSNSIPVAIAKLPENHLALCPVCAAKFKYARRDDETEMLAALRESEQAEISVVLAGKEESIKFVNVHRNDLLAALGAIDAKGKRLA